MGQDLPGPGHDGGGRRPPGSSRHDLRDERRKLSPAGCPRTQTRPWPTAAPRDNPRQLLSDSTTINQGEKQWRSRFRAPKIGRTWCVPAASFRTRCNSLARGGIAVPTVVTLPTLKPSIALARQSHHGNDVNAVTPDSFLIVARASHADCRAISAVPAWPPPSAPGIQLSARSL